MRKGEDRGATPLQRALAAIPPGASLPWIHVDDALQPGVKSSASAPPRVENVISSRSGRTPSSREIGRQVSKRHLHVVADPSETNNSHSSVHEARLQVLKRPQKEVNSTTGSSGGETPDESKVDSGAQRQARLETAKKWQSAAKLGLLSGNSADSPRAASSTSPRRSCCSWLGDLLLWLVWVCCFCGCCTMWWPMSRSFDHSYSCCCGYCGSRCARGGCCGSSKTVPSSRRVGFAAGTADEPRSVHESPRYRR